LSNSLMCHALPWLTLFIMTYIYTSAFSPSCRFYTPVISGEEIICMHVTE
jgi:hypothetical protein